MAAPSEGRDCLGLFAPTPQLALPRSQSAPIRGRSTASQLYCVTNLSSLSCAMLGHRDDRREEERINENDMWVHMGLLFNGVKVPISSYVLIRPTKQKTSTTLPLKQTLKWKGPISKI